MKDRTEILKMFDDILLPLLSKPDGMSENVYYMKISVAKSAFLLGYIARDNKSLLEEVAKEFLK